MPPPSPFLIEYVAVPPVHWFVVESVSGSLPRTNAVPKLGTIVVPAGAPTGARRTKSTPLAVPPFAGTVRGASVPGATIVGVGGNARATRSVPGEAFSAMYRPVPSVVAVTQAVLLQICTTAFASGAVVTFS